MLLFCFKPASVRDKTKVALKYNKQRQRGDRSGESSRVQSRFWHGFGGELADFGERHLEDRSVVRIEVSRWVCHTCTRRSGPNKRALERHSESPKHTVLVLEYEEGY